VDLDLDTTTTGEVMPNYLHIYLVPKRFENVMLSLLKNDTQTLIV